MDNGHNKTYNGIKPEETMYSGNYKMPKNIRQIGNIPIHNKTIYVEDYVMTFMKQIAQRDPSNCNLAVLLGYYIITDQKKNIFVKGAVEVKNIDLSAGTSFTDEGWTSIYENIKKYFTDVEIVGWAITGSGFFIENEDILRKIHMENFSGVDKILLKIDTLEKDEVFYLFENHQLGKQSGYYIYYEKNEEMQNYMIEAKNPVSEELNYQDRTTKKIRTIIQEKNEQKQSKVDDKSIVKLLYAASTLLAIIVLVIAGTMLNNYKKMKDMEKTLYTISESLSKNADNTGKENVKKETTKAGQESSNLSNNETEDQENSNKQNAIEEILNAGNPSDDANKEDSNKDSEAVEVVTIPGDVSSEESQTVEESKENTSDSDTETKEDSKEEVKVTPEPTPTKEPTPKPTKEPEKEKPAGTKETSNEVKYYVVQPGDSLAGISYKLYNSANYIEKIKELNGIEDENKIYAGQKLIIP